MEDGLSLDNILDQATIDNLFTDSDTDTSDEVNNNETKENKQEPEETTEVDAETLFSDEPESVGSEEKDTKEREDTKSNKAEGTPPNNNFYSSIAKALREEGTFPDLTDDDLASIKTPEDFNEAVEKQLQAKFDARQKRIDDALNAGIEVSDIKKYENTINYLDSIKETDLSDESNDGEKLRKDLIYQDFINRGYSKERAEREVKKSLDSGSDIEDAKEALTSNKEYFENEYNKLVKEAKEQEQKASEEANKKVQELKNSILSDDKVFGEIQVDKATRQKVIDNISKPVYKDQKTGISYTALQQYQREHSVDFLKNVGLIFTLTDGFKNLDGLVKNKVRKEVKKGLKELENVISGSQIPFDNNLKYISSVSEEEEEKSPLANGWSIDV